MSTTTWQSKAKAKRDTVNELIPQAWRLSNVATAEEHRDITGTYLHQYLEPLEIEITESTAEQIVNKTSSGAWKAETVARAFAHRAALVHQHLNCIHEIFFEAAFQNARKLDEYLAEHKKPVGPLHGLPVSLKDQMHVEGVETSMGYVGWLGTFQGKTGTGKERVFESEIVRELRNLGAVLYCKTSVPQTLMCVETVNNIVGYTFNPKNRNLSSGGSSGGEGALIGAKGSPLGWGTDIGGSVRLPSGFCGIYGLRPSQCRMPYEGMANSMDGQNTILSVVGPISGSIGGVRLAMKSLLSQQPWLHDPLVLEIPWREEQCQAVADASKVPDGLSFGILWTDDVHQPFPPVTRALHQVADALKRKGRTVVDWNPPSHAEGLEVSSKTWFYDGGIDVRKDFELSGEPIHEQIVVGHALTEEVKAMDIAANNVARREYQKRYMDYWNSTAAVSGTTRPVDAFICPVHHSPAPRPQKFRNASYTTIFNVLDYSVCTFPVTTADKNVDLPNTNFKAYSAADEQSQGDYDPEIYHGAHVCLQLVGRRLQEEKVVALVDYVSSVLHGADGGARL